MNTYSGFFWITAALAAVLLLGVFRKHVELIINFVLRGILGMLLLYFGNYFLAGWMPGLHMGYNFLTFCVAGFLGTPGIFMLYGIGLYMAL